MPEFKIEVKKEDLRPIKIEEERDLLNKFSQVATISQIAGNSMQRQLFTSIGAHSLLSGKTNIPQEKPNHVGGWQYRFGQQALVTYPILRMREMLDDNGISRSVVTLLSAAVDTAGSMPFESLATKETFKKIGINLSVKDSMMATTRSFIPFYMRNALSWLGVNSDLDKLWHKTTFGAFTGAATVPFHNVGTMAMAHPEKTFNEVWKTISDEIIKTPNLLFRGAIPRAVTTSGAAIILSPHSHKVITEWCGKFKDMLDKDSPNSSPNPESCAKIQNRTIIQEK